MTYTSFRLRPARLLALSLCLIGSAAAQSPQAPPPTPAPTGLAVTLDGLVAEALASNLALRQRTFDLAASRHALDAARRRFWPAFSAEARFTRAGGGRTIDLPLGDVLNPVYATLNDLLAAQGQTAAFPTVENESVRFLRTQEQDTRLRVVQPIYQPRLAAAVRARRHLVAAGEAEVAAYRRELVRDVKVGYFRYVQAERSIAIYQAAADLVDENLRTAARLQQADKVLADAVLRARAETFAVAQQVAEAEQARDLARAYLNVLLNRPLDTPLAVPDEASLDRLLLPPSSPTLLRAAAVVDAPAAPGGLADLQTTALGRRFELESLEAAARAQEAAIAGARADVLPSVALALEGGVQGRSYGFGGEGPFYLASAVLSWTLFGGGSERAEVQQARAELARIEAQREEAALQIRLQVQEAYDAVRVARATLAAADERLAAAQEGFRITERLVAEGRANQVQFVDARTALTSAALNLNVTRYALLTRLAELEYAAGLTPPAPAP